MSEKIALGDIHGPLEFVRETERFLLGLDFMSVQPTDQRFRPGTELPVVRINYIFKGSGMGDYICYMPAMIWTAINNPWIYGRVFVGEFFTEFARNIIEQTGNKNWSVCPREREEEILSKDSFASLSRGPGIEINGYPNHQMLNGTGGHLIDVGLALFANKLYLEPKWRLHPQIDFSVWGDHIRLPDTRYVVLTPGNTTPSRSVPGAYWNPIIDHVKSLGLLPVFLGVDRICDLTIKFPDGCNYDQGLDLRNKTTMMQAAWIMANSDAVVGLDNGLIHLAACTDANIIAAYNIVDPDDRRPRRSFGGKYEEITISKDELSCAGCQSWMANMYPHAFNRCLYNDTKCVDLLFENGASRFIEALDKILLNPRKV